MTPIATVHIVTVDLELPVTLSGTYREAEPDVGIMYPWFEDIVVTIGETNVTNEEPIQKFLANNEDWINEILLQEWEEMNWERGHDDYS